MPIDDPNRVGPNQDVNDPSLLVEVGYEFNRISKNIGSGLAISQSQNPNASGSKIIDIIIPLNIFNGTTISFDCKNIIRNEELNIFDYDKILWSSGLINTYINLAERFRDYWNTLNNTIGDLQSFGITEEINVSPHPTGSYTYLIDPIFTVISGSLGGKSFNINNTIFNPEDSFTSPAWSGSGPINYNSGTYPQLLEEILKLEVNISTVNIGTWSEIYYWINGEAQELTFGGNPHARMVFLEDDFYGFINPSSSNIQWIHIHNSGIVNQTVNISALTTYNRTFFALSTSNNESAIAESYVIISGISFSPPATLFAASLIPGVWIQEIDSFSSPSTNGSLSLLASHARIVTIPPNLSAFIAVRSNSQCDLVSTTGTVSLATDVEIQSALGTFTRSSIKNAGFG